MKNFLSSNPNRLDPLSGKPKMTRDEAIKIGQFLESTDERFADFVVASKKIIEQPAPVARPKLKHDKRRPTTPGLAY